MEVQNTPFVVNLSCGSNIYFDNISISATDARVTIQFGSINFLVIVAKTNDTLAPKASVP